MLFIVQKSRLMVLPLAILLAATAACSTSPISSTAQQVAEGGQQYVSTLKKVNALALDHSLEFTADLLPTLPRNQSTLQEQTQAMRERAQTVSLVNSYLDVQAQYFAQLQALAKGDQSAATQKAVKGLADALSALPSPVKSGVAGLAAHVSTAAHNREVALVLQRDADVVAQALLFNQQVLEEQAQWITYREKLAREVAYRDEVEKPYVGDKKLGETWKKAWVSSIKPSPTLQLLTEARQASLRMQQAWLEVLRGQGNINQLGAVFNQLNAQVQASMQVTPTQQVQP